MQQPSPGMCRSHTTDPTCGGLQHITFVRGVAGFENTLTILLLLLVATIRATIRLGKGVGG